MSQISREISPCVSVSVRFSQITIFHYHSMEYSMNISSKMFRAHIKHGFKLKYHRRNYSTYL